MVAANGSIGHRPDWTVQQKLRLRQIFTKVHPNLKCFIRSPNYVQSRCFFGVSRRIFLNQFPHFRNTISLVQ